MKNTDEIINNLYLKEEYITQNPTLHEEDSPWKVSKIIPLIDDLCLNHINKPVINILDVGGGAGLILSAISTYITKTYTLKVNKFAVDLSKEMLEIQKKRNPDLVKALNEDFQSNSIGNKEIDITLMVDLLEHIPCPEAALRELKRISNFAILKVPLEDNLIKKTWNFVRGGKPRQRSIKTIGHINVFNNMKIKSMVNKHTGAILDCYFTNVFDYFHLSTHYQKKRSPIKRYINSVARYSFKLSPTFTSYIFNDFFMILVKCY